MQNRDEERAATTTPELDQEHTVHQEHHAGHLKEYSQDRLELKGGPMEPRQDKGKSSFTSRGKDELHNSEWLDTNEDDILLSLSDFAAQFDDALRWGNELERRIEGAIDDISLGGFNTGKEIGQTFRELHERLNAEEAKVMEELERINLKFEEPLQKTLCKLKETFEYSNTPDYESIKKKDGMDVDSYMKEIEERQREIEGLLNTTLTSPKISWDPEKRKLSFAEHLINGVPVPNDITFYSVCNKSIDISWECDNSGLREEDRERLLFHVEARRRKNRTKNEGTASKDTKENYLWKEVYLGTANRHVIHGLEVDTEYDVRIKCSIGDLDGRWSEAESFRTENTQISSAILEAEKDEETFCGMLTEWCGSTDFDLLYRGTRDGFSASSFHRMCDNQGKTLVLIKNKSGHVFGGFATTSWRHSASYANKQAPGSFLFTLTNIYGIEPTKFPLMDEEDRCAICHYNNTYGALFGESGFDLGISTDCDRNISSWSSFPYNYYDSTGKGGNIFSSNTKLINFGVQEIEVFRVNTLTNDN